MSAPPRQRGRLRVADRALVRIAVRAARDGSPAVRRVRAAVHRRSDGADVVLRLAVNYPSVLPEAVGSTASAVGTALAATAGVTVRRSRVTVTALLPGGPLPAASARPAGAPRAVPARRAPRSRVERRLPTALVSLAGAATCGGLLVVQHCGCASLGHLSALVNGVAGRRAGDPVVAGGAVLLAAAGLGLLALALTGLRRTGLPCSPPGPTPVVVDAALVEREVRRAVGPRDTVAVTVGRSVRVAATGAADDGELRAAAERGLRRTGFRGTLPGLAVRGARPTAPVLPPRTPTEEP